ncbi:MAG: prolipoprotein diacylglyceryl transferase [Candidatus Omnitrophica bacterium]|nr:prolipoprotein diacylglyceryl transferase [Candidatus Omnitrophota bacterium]MDD5488365.1 prolipoprotein diacylglyceryl transferase [Candidatus Omnitrophota bacterium]
MHPVLFSLWGIDLHTYGLFVALGFITASVLAVREATAKGLKPEPFMDMLIAILVGGIAGGRGLFVVLNWGQFSSAPLDIFKLYQGGLAIQGAMVGSALAAWLVVSRAKIRFLAAADILAPYIALGQAIGRIGCFMNGCCYGKTTTCFAAVVLPGEIVPRIPTQLYYSAGLLLMFILLSLLKKKQYFEGAMFSFYLMLYSILRMTLDALRGDLMPLSSGFTLSQVIAMFFFVLGALLFVVSRARKGKACRK